MKKLFLPRVETAFFVLGLRSSRIQNIKIPIKAAETFSGKKMKNDHKKSENKNLCWMILTKV